MLSNNTFYIHLSRDRAKAIFLLLFFFFLKYYRQWKKNDKGVFDHMKFVPMVEISILPLGLQNLFNSLLSAE